MKYYLILNTNVFYCGEYDTRLSCEKSDYFISMTQGSFKSHNINMYESEQTEINSRKYLLLNSYEYMDLIKSLNKSLDIII